MLTSFRQSSVLCVSLFLQLLFAATLGLFIWRSRNKTLVSTKIWTPPNIVQQGKTWVDPNFVKSFSNKAKSCPTVAQFCKSCAKVARIFEKMRCYFGKQVVSNNKKHSQFVILILCIAIVRHFVLKCSAWPQCSERIKYQMKNI